jgi:hypothetical protein
LRQADPPLERVDPLLEAQHRLGRCASANLVPEIV